MMDALRRRPSLAALAVVVLAIGKALWDASRDLEVIDLWIVSRAGSELFGSGWIDVFSDQGLQVGPLILLVQGSLWEISSATGVRLEMLFSLLVQPVVILSCLWLVGAGIENQRRRFAAQAVVASLLFVWEIHWNAYVFGHPTEFLIPIIWLVAARLAYRGHPVRAGLAVAVSGGFKLWGILGVPLLLLAPRAWGRLHAVGAAGAGMVLLYGPFLLSGEVNTFGYRWIVEAGTGPSWMLDPGTGFGWPLRLFQGAVALTTGAGVALLSRTRGELVLWAPALAIIGARLATDPTALAYYWLAPQAVLLVAAGWLIGRDAALPALALVGLAGLAFFASAVSDVGLALVLVLVSAGAALFADRMNLTRLPLRRTARAG